jgi:AcrR family transcriptional regulator
LGLLSNLVLEITENMSTRSRNQEEKALRREILLDAAQSIFFKKGFENTSMADIALESGFSRALLYVYFKGKKDIYRNLRIRSLEVLLKRTKQLVEQADSGIEKLKKIGKAYHLFYLNDRKHFDCLSVDISLSNQTDDLERQSEKDPELLAVEKNMMHIMVAAIEIGKKDGTIDPFKVPNPLQTAMFLRGSLHGVIMLTNENGKALLEKAGLDKYELVEYTIENGTNTLKH